MKQITRMYDVLNLIKDDPMPIEDIMRNTEKIGITQSEFKNHIKRLKLKGHICEIKKGHLALTKQDP